MTMEQAIERNRRRQAMFRKAERQLRAIRLKIFDYEDEGKLDKAERIIAKLEARLEPLWAARSHAVTEEKMRNYMM